MNQNISRQPIAYENLSPASLIQHAVVREEGYLANTGALVVATGKRTGLSLADRFIVKDLKTETHVDWGNVNRSMDNEKFDALWQQVDNYLNKKTALSCTCM